MALAEGCAMALLVRDMDRRRRPVGGAGKQRLAHAPPPRVKSAALPNRYFVSRSLLAGAMQKTETVPWNEMTR